MKNYISMKLIAFFALIFVAAGYALPASADMTTAGFYDQFGNFHLYQTYAAPTNYSGYPGYGYTGQSYNYGYSYQTPGYYYGTPNYYGTSGQYQYFNSRPQSASGYQPGATVTSGQSSSYYSQAPKSSEGSFAGIVTGKVSKSDSADDGQTSAISSIFGGKKGSEELAISDIVVTSGPKDISEGDNEKNCNVRVSWSTSVASAGQVVYGATSQQSIDSFKYTDVATESTSYQTGHEVTLGCLANTTYYFRVIAFSDEDRVVSDEHTIFPVKILTQIPSAAGGVASAIATVGGGSSKSVIGSIFTNPIVLFVVVVAIGYLLYAKFIRKEGNSGPDAHHGAPAHAEPALNIPHH